MLRVLPGGSDDGERNREGDADVAPVEGRDAPEKVAVAQERVSRGVKGGEGTRGAFRRLRPARRSSGSRSAMSCTP